MNFIVIKVHGKTIKRFFFVYSEIMKGLVSVKKLPITFYFGYVTYSFFSSVKKG